MARFLYRILRVANVVGRFDEESLRKAMSSPSLLESIARLSDLDKPLSYALPLTGNAMAPLFNIHLLETANGANDAARPKTFPAAEATGDSTSQGQRDTLVIRQLNPSPPTFLNSVHVNDIVVIRDPNDDRRKYVRRITALEGTEMISERPGDEPFLIPSNHCWVQKENVNATTAPDSNVFGPLSLKNIIGRVMYAIRSAADHGRVSNSSYAMASDAIVLAQESVVPFIDEHGHRNRPGGADGSNSNDNNAGGDTGRA